MMQEIDNLVGETLKPIDENDYESDPFDMRMKGIEQELDRIEEFDLRTQGDMHLFDMLDTAKTLLYSHKVDVYTGNPDKFGGRWIACLSDIRRTIDRRAYTGEGACNIRPGDEPGTSETAAESKSPTKNADGAIELPPAKSIHKINPPADAQAAAQEAAPHQ